jgi:DNA primase catalytic core
MRFHVGMPELRDLDGRGLPVWITPAPDAILLDDVDQPAPDVASSAVAEPVDEEARARAVEIHEAAWGWWTEQKTSQAWAGEYMGGRGLADAEWGVAPAGWTNLVDHLTNLGYTPEQLVEAGVATITRRGAAIDRFRDRIVFPFRDRAGDIVGVTARINPAVDDPKAPKYLNTPATEAFRKSELLLGLTPEAAARLAAGARPVLVEGPTDVAAMERMAPDVVPVAAAGTAVTEQHLQALRDASGRDLTDLIVALDGDVAGQKAAARVWGMLTDEEASRAGALVMPGGADPAQLLADGRASEVTLRLSQPPEALTHIVLDRAVDQIAQFDSLPQQVEILRDAVQQAAARVDIVELPAAGAYLMARLDGVMPTDSVAIAFSEEATAAARARAPQTPEPRTDPVVASWLNAQASLIAERLDGLLDQAVVERPQWMASITDQPTQPGPRHEWTNAVRQVVAYRDRYQVTDTDSPLGPSVARGDQGTAYQAAAQALGSITRDEEPSELASPPPARSMDRVAALLAEARARAAENDARQAEPNDRARREAEERQRREREREQQDRSRDDGLER